MGLDTFQDVTVLLCVRAVEPVIPYQKGKKPSRSSLEGRKRSFTIELRKGGHCHDKNHHPVSQDLPLTGLKARPRASGVMVHPLCLIQITDLSLDIQKSTFSPCACHWQRCWAALVPVSTSEGHHSPQLCTWTFEPLTTTHFESDLQGSDSFTQWSRCQISSLLLTDKDVLMGSPKCPAQIQVSGASCSVLVRPCHSHTRPSNLSHVQKHQVQWLQEM